jgi:hypothetical protein
MKKYVTRATGRPTFVHWPSPTFSFESHNKWGSNHFRALSAMHEKIPPEVCGTIGFAGGDKITIALFLRRYREKMAYQNKKHPQKKKSAIFGVLEIREYDDLIHMHWIARNFEIVFLDELIAKFNNKHKTRFTIMYYDIIEGVKNISRYPFKFFDDTKLIFKQGTLNRYVYQTGNYFLGMKKRLEREGFVEFICDKAIRNFDENILCYAEDFI